VRERRSDLLLVPRPHRRRHVVLFSRIFACCTPGDLFFNGHYPNSTLEAGGSGSSVPDSSTRCSRCRSTTVIPGTARRRPALSLERFLPGLSWRQLGPQIVTIHELSGRLGRDAIPARGQSTQFGPKPLLFAPPMLTSSSHPSAWQSSPAPPQDLP